MASMLNVKPIETRTSKTDMLLTWKTIRLEVYGAKIEGMDGNYALEAVEALKKSLVCR